MKKEVKYEALHLHSNDPIPFSAITIDLQPDDIIISGYDEGFYSENESWDPHFYLIVERKRLETDEEYKERTSMDAFLKEDLRKRRYEQYLKLKKEFEND